MINYVEADKVGKTWAGLQPYERAALSGVAALRSENVKFLFETPEKNNPSITNGIRINNVRYGVEIKPNKNRTDLVYTLKQGNKILVKEGTHENALNQLAIISKKK